MQCDPQQIISKSVRLVFDEGVIRIAIQPTLAGLRRCNHRVSAPTRMLARVVLRRAVAAEGRAALLTRSEMNPLCADLYALGAFAHLRLLHGINGVEMITTTIGHNYFLLLFEAANRR